MTASSNAELAQQRLVKARAEERAEVRAWRDGPGKRLDRADALIWGAVLSVVVGWLLLLARSS